MPRWSTGPEGAGNSLFTEPIEERLQASATLKALDAADTFDQLVGGIDYPMYIVTATGADRSGCLVGFAAQASIGPPRLLVMLSKANHTYRTAQAIDTLAVHFLGRENHELAQLFGEDTGDEVDKFGRCDWQPGPRNTTILAGTRGWIVGHIINRTDVGDHVGHLLDPVAGDVDRAAPPLTFQAVRDMTPGHPA